MTTRREISHLSLEEASTNDQFESFPEGSDDELEETVRGAKRRRIEALGESYLQGKPLFISSASLRGPFDNGWVNPWKKHRKGHKAAATRTKTTTTTKSEINLVQERGSLADNIRGRKGEGSRGSHPSEREPLRISKTSKSPLNSEKSQPKSLWIHHSSTRQEVERLSPNVPATKSWLKRDAKTINVQSYNPPKSPSSRYAKPGVSGIAKRPKNARMKGDAGVDPATKSYQTNLRNVRRSKAISGDSQEKRPRAGRNHSSPTPHEPAEYCHSRASKDQGTKETKPSPTLNTRKYDSQFEYHNQNASPKSPGPESAPPKATVPAGTSSVYVDPPSSHLQQFGYRLSKSQTVKGSTKRRETQILRNGVAFSNENFLKGSEIKRRLPTDDCHFPGSAQGQTSTATLGSSQNREGGSTESNNIPSAQLLPKQQGISDCFISLHTTETCDLGTAERATGSVDEELSTQAAFELAQKSFQAGLATPEKDPQYPSTTTTKRGANPSVNRITPFANVNVSPSMLNLKIGPQHTPGIAHNMNTQAMIDAISPFNEAVSDSSGRKTAQRFFHQSATHSESRWPNNIATSPHPIPRQMSLHESSNKGVRESCFDSLPPLPLTLSGATPATNQQEGQALIFGTDALDVSQVIQDAGSWLRQSWDISDDLKRCPASTERETRSSPPSSHREIALV